MGEPELHGAVRPRRRDERDHAAGPGRPGPDHRPGAGHDDRTRRRDRLRRCSWSRGIASSSRRGWRSASRSRARRRPRAMRCCSRAARSIIALLSLALAGIPIVTTLGLHLGDRRASIAVAARSRCAGLLGVLGLRINALRAARAFKTHHDERPHGWQRWARARRQPAVAGAGRRRGRSCGARDSAAQARISDRRTSARSRRTRRRARPTTA